MILASHAIIGAAAGRLFPFSPLLAFAAGLVSHYAMDAIPHWEYEPPLISRNPAVPPARAALEMRFALRTFLALGDLGAGVLLSLLIFPDVASTNMYSFAAGIIGGVLPDALQFVYALFPMKLLKAHQHIHDTIHSTQDLKDRPFLGVPLQVIIVAVWVALSRTLQ